jgi:hypothetical protein
MSSPLSIDWKMGVSRLDNKLRAELFPESAPNAMMSETVAEKVMARQAVMRKGVRGYAHRIVIHTVHDAENLR